MSLVTRQFSDIDLTFDRHPVTKDILKKTNENAIATSVYNLLMTTHYERPFNPDLGSNLKKMLFEPIDSVTTSVIQDMIFQTIKNYEPRVEVQSVLATPDYDNNGYRVSIIFFIKNTTDPLTITLFLERVR